MFIGEIATILLLYRFVLREWIVDTWETKLRQEGELIDGSKLAKYLSRYAAIGEKYVAILEAIIEKNSLTDFDKASLLPTKLKKGIAL